MSDVSFLEKLLDGAEVEWKLHTANHDLSPVGYEALYPGRAAKSPERLCSTRAASAVQCGAEY